jgi:hypothetical protein
MMVSSYDVCYNFTGEGLLCWTYPRELDAMKERQPISFPFSMEEEIRKKKLNSRSVCSILIHVTINNLIVNYYMKRKQRQRENNIILIYLWFGAEFLEHVPY